MTPFATSHPSQVSARTSGWVRSALPMGEVRALTGPQADRSKGLKTQSRTCCGTSWRETPARGPGLRRRCND